VRAADRRSLTFTVRLPRREPGQPIEEEGSKMSVTRDERELGRRQPLGVPGKYLSLTTYRRDGTPVSTPVWFVEEEGRLFVTTAADSYKAKRLRRNPAAMVAPCTARGLPKGDAIPVQVEFLPPDAHARVDWLMAEKYRLDRILILPIYRLVMKLHGKPVNERTGAYLAITST
jgi:uncharacterized protein